MKNDKLLILDFVHELYDWLDTTFLNKNNDHKWPTISIRDELNEDAEKAWLHFKKDYPKSYFNRSIGQFKDKRLKSHGLYGDQLKYKLSVVKVAVDDAKSDRQGWQRKLLDILDNLLESIGDGLPGYGALKELKDSLLVGV